jgi:hemerythrin-like domain-containing protein
MPFAATCRSGYIDNVRHHVEEEESEMLPQARQVLGGDRLRQLGERMADREEQLGSA